MEDKIITLATLTFEKAQLVKTLLENEGVSCFLEHINLIQGAVSSGVKINIREADFEQAMMVFDAIRESDYNSEPHDVISTQTVKILVPVDFSEYSQKAVDVAFDWVVKQKGEITLFNSYFTPLNTGIPFSDSFVYDVNTDEVSLDMEEESERKMELLQKDLEKRISEKKIKDVNVKAIVRRGVAEHEILAYSEHYKPSVIVMGTRGADKKAVDLIGSVTAEIIESAKVPVLAIPESFEYSGIEKIKRVGYLSVFENADFVAIDKLSNIVNSIDVDIICSHISSLSEVDINKVKLDGLVEHFRNHAINKKLSFKLTENEDFWVGIESFIQTENIDILSFTTYKRNLISRLLNASVAKKMLFHSTTPLLVFHA
ncbi:universal stress protein UspA [Labilibacter sediminis]|nr:universal stress protein UspA [Labilibacter sediminis]